MPQTALPDDPMEMTQGSRFLRLTNECPKQGVVLVLEEPTIVKNDKFGKDEYQWPCVQYMPQPIEKTMTESSPGFCVALKKATGGKPYRIPLQIRWVKTVISGGRQVREWSIKVLESKDIPQIFAEG